MRAIYMLLDAVPSICTGCHRWIASCSELPTEKVLNEAHMLRTKIMHKYLPPVDVEVSRHVVSKSPILNYMIMFIIEIDHQFIQCLQ